MDAAYGVLGLVVEHTEKLVETQYLDLLSLTCPRCDRDVEVRFYGPCPECVAALHAKYPGAPRTIAIDEYVPKMNVTPNAVATKD